MVRTYAMVIYALASSCRYIAWTITLPFVEGFFNCVVWRAVLEPA